VYRVSNYVIKHGKRIFGGYTKACAHGAYIRPDYISVWREAARQADAQGLSLSEFVSQALYVFMTGKRPHEEVLRGRNPIKILKK
jgi:hypothetical protein